MRAAWVTFAAGTAQRASRGNVDRLRIAYIDPAPARLRQVAPAPNWNPDACWSDEGYGRFETCDAAGM
jgi:hypothetical protein